MKLNNLDLNKLKCFQAVAEKGSLQAGARHLNLTTSAVYQSVRKLEDDMQRHLFFRSGKKYILTDDGRNLQELFQKFLWDFSQFQEQLRPAGDVLEGEIRVGLPLNFSKSVFVPLMRKFQEEFPRVRFNLTVAETRRLMDQISSFELDFAITDDSVPQEFLSKVVMKEIIKEELALVCSKSFFKENEKAILSSKTIKDLTHLDYSRNLPLIQRWYKLHYKRQVKISNFHIIDNVETMLAALKEGMGLGIIPRDLLATTMGRDLQLIPTESGALFNPLLLIQESNYINNTLMKRFLLHLQTGISSK